jgi:hypothetical protein
MGTTPIPLTTLSPNQVIDSSVIPQMTQSVGTFTDFQLSLNRNVGAASLDNTPTASIQLFTEWSADNQASWHGGMSAMVPGGTVWVDKAQTVRQEVFATEWPFAAALAAVGIVPTHIRGRVVNGPVSVSVSGSVTLS